MAVEFGSQIFPFTSGISTSTGATQGTSQQSTQQSSQSTSGPVATPQSELSLILSKAAEQAGQGVLSWAQSMLAPDQAITDAAINHYFNTALTQEGLANTTASQYYNQTMPQMTAENNLAATYNSPSRQQFAAGQAESAAVQGGLAGVQNAEQQLQSYGINPGSGVYQELSKASQAAIGAGAAAAGQQAATGVQNTGISLLQGAIAQGQQLPGQSVNSANAGTQAISGAQNAQLANTQTGAQAQSTAQPFLQTASNLTPEQIASQSSSQSSSQGTSQETGTSNAQSTSYTPMVQNIYNPGQSGAGNPVTGAKGGAIPMLAGGGGLKIMHAHIPSAPLLHAHGGNKPVSVMGGYGSKGHKGGNRGGGGPKDPLAGVDLGSTNPGNTSPKNAFLHSDAELQQAYGEAPRGRPQQQQQQESQSDGSPLPIATPIGDATGVQSTPGPDVGQTATPSIPASATGGIPMGAGGATTGGFVSRSLSPSHGAKVDDIPARLNADEFVMPRDVTKYYGHKHLQDMIVKARKAMGDPQKNPAQPSFGKAMGGLPSGIPAPGAPTGDTASMASPNMQQYSAQMRHPDASAPW